MGVQPDIIMVITLPYFISYIRFLKLQMPAKGFIFQTFLIEVA